MSKIYSRLFYHAIWATKYRENILTEKIENHLYDCFRMRAENYGYILHACNGYKNHVHLALTIFTTKTISNVIGEIKGGVFSLSK